MNKYARYLILISVFILSQCRAYREVVEPPSPTPVGMNGFRFLCAASDTIRTITISKATTLITADDERYEAEITLYAIRDSLIYISAVNNGFEILRASADPDTIKVIDRLNKIVYRTPVKRRYGHQNPVNFQDIQNLISRYNLCDDLEKARELESLHIVFNCNEPYIKKQIFLDRESLIMDQFEFSHTETGKYIRGERTGEGIRIYSNFMISEFEVLAQGGQLAYNKKIQVKMQVNPKRYSIINL